jgi:hypothetical protein
MIEYINMVYIGNNDRADSVASFERMERQVNEDLVFKKLGLDPKYKLSIEDIITETKTPEGFTMIKYSNGAEIIEMQNNMKKRVYVDGLTILCLPNSDIKVVSSIPIIEPYRATLMVKRNISKLRTRRDFEMKHARHWNLWNLVSKTILIRIAICNS